MNKLQLTLSGDYLDNSFILYSANLSFGDLSFSIFLTAEQTQMAIDYDDAFEPVLELMNALSDAGIAYIQKIDTEQDNEEDLEGFLNNHNDVDIEPWTDVNILTLTDTNSATSEGGNIIIESNSGHIFEISTENYEDSTSMIICQLSELLKKTGVKIILN